MSLLLIFRSFSLGRIADIFVGHRLRSGASEAYVVIWFAVLIMLLWFAQVPNLWVIAVVTYRLIDALSCRLCILFVDRHEKDWALYSLNRSLLLLLINYCEIVVGFAIIFLHTASIKCVSTPLEALYFSAVTAATVGFGDYYPSSPIGQYLVVGEIASSFILVVLVIGVFLTGAHFIRESGVSASKRFHHFSPHIHRKYPSDSIRTKRSNRFPS